MLAFYSTVYEKHAGRRPCLGQRGVDGALNEKEARAASSRQRGKLIQELDEKDRKTIFNIIDTMLTKNKFKDFFN
ncbi:MAG: hypothetical protein ACQETL_19980, partial [Bacteroidota bacterium]